MEQALLFETENEIGKIIAANEKRFRKRKKITQKRLSQLSGVPVPTIARFEQRGEISLLSFIKINMALGVSWQMKDLFQDIPCETVEEALIDARH